MENSLAVFHGRMIYFFQLCVSHGSFETGRLIKETLSSVTVKRFYKCSFPSCPQTEGIVSL